MFDYEIVENLFRIPRGDSMALELNIIAWGRYAPKLDLRLWRREGGQDIPGKGFTLSLEEAETVANVLSGYLADLPADLSS